MQCSPVVVAVAAVMKMRKNAFDAMMMMMMTLAMGIKCLMEMMIIVMVLVMMFVVIGEQAKHALSRHF